LNDFLLLAILLPRSSCSWLSIILFYRSNFVWEEWKKNEQILASLLQNRSISVQNAIFVLFFMCEIRFLNVYLISHANIRRKLFYMLVFSTISRTGNFMFAKNEKISCMLSMRNLFSFIHHYHSTIHSVQIGKQFKTFFSPRLFNSDINFLSHTHSKLSCDVS
jgi:hypothetical protein